MRPPRAGLIGLSGFFAIGAIIAATTAVALLAPGGILEPIWRLNPRAPDRFLAMGAGAPVLMVGVATACGAAAIGLWTRARWGHRLALALLGVSLTGDATNALVFRDPLTLIGLPVGGALVAYLLSARVRGEFAGDRRGR